MRLVNCQWSVVSCMVVVRMPSEKKMSTADNTQLTGTISLKRSNY